MTNNPNQSGTAQGRGTLAASLKTHSKMPYYKILNNLPSIGTIIDTETNYDEKRIKRFRRLNKLFSYIFKISQTNNIPVFNILSTLYPEKFQTEIKINNQDILEISLEDIRKEIIITNFKVDTEFRQFTDFVLDSARNEITNNQQLPLPDRFKSHYFFQSIEDCLRYKSNLIHANPGIIEVDFISLDKIFKMDNEHLTHFENHFTSVDYYSKATDFLLQKSTENPLFEIIFQGKYKVVAHI